MVNREGVFQRADGSLSDAWGNTVDESEVSFDEGDTQEDEETTGKYADLTAQQLKDEVKARQEAGRTFDLTGVRTKADLARVLEADDAAQAQEG